MFTKVRKKPVEVEAVQVTAENINELAGTEIDGRKIQLGISGNTLGIATLEGYMKAKVTDWIIKGVNGEIYPCKDEIFRKTYEIVS